MDATTLSRVPRYCGIWSKKKSANTTRWLRTLLQQYLDEDTKKRDSRPAPGQAEPLMPGHDYTPFASGIWVFGHVANKVAEAGYSPAYSQPQQVIEQVAEWWARDRDESVIKAHHVVASFDPRIAAELHRRGYPVDAMLLASVHQTLSQYAARFYPGGDPGLGCRMPP